MDTPWLREFEGQHKACIYLTQFWVPGSATASGLAPPELARATVYACNQPKCRTGNFREPGVRLQHHEEPELDTRQTIGLL